MTDVKLAQVRRVWENACDCMYSIEWRTINPLLASITVADYRVADDGSTLVLCSNLIGAADRFLRQNKGFMALRFTEALGYSQIPVDHIVFE